MKLINRILRLEVILPKVDGIIAFSSVRSGHQAYDGPNLIDEMRDAKLLLGSEGGDERSDL